MHPSSNIAWIDDRLPGIHAIQGVYDLVTLSGVWQHLPDDDRAAAMPNLARIMAPGGLLILSLRHGPGGEGRRVFQVHPDATVTLAEAEGLSLLRCREAESVGTANRAMEVTWTWLAFRKAN